MVYIRTTRKETPILYSETEAFTVGGSKVLRKRANDVITVVTAGITVHEALAAYEALRKDGISIRVIDLYSIKPINVFTLGRAAAETKMILTVEDHYPEGGLGEAVQSAVTHPHVPVHILAVRNMPRSGKSAELLDYEEISRSAIVRKAKELT